MSSPPPKRVLGLRVGLAGDSLDAAEIVSDGARIVALGAFRRFPLTAAERAALASGDLAAAGRVVEDAAARALDAFDGPDVVALQGPILAYDPGRALLQEAGDGALLAQAAGLPVVWDMFSADMALGGLGLPVPALYAHALARHARAPGPVALLDLGTRASLWWTDPVAEVAHAPGAILALEPGPGMALLNALVDDAAGDVGGTLAARGGVAEAIPEEILARAHYLRTAPKCADPGLAEAALLAVAELPQQDAAATLCAIIAASVAEALPLLTQPPAAIWVSGGGRHHQPLMRMIAALCPLPVTPFEDLGLNGDAMKAQAIGHAAARLMAGLPTSAPGTTGVASAVGGGTVSRPAAR